MKVKVAHVITRLDLGGAQHNTLHTVRCLDRERYDPILICGRGGFHDAEVVADGRIRVRFIESLVREIRLPSDFVAFAALWRAFRKERPTIVHTHSSKAGILGRMAAACARVPLVVHTYHGFGFHDHQNPIVKFAYILLEKICALCTDRIIFVSRANARYAERHGLGTASNATIIRSGIALARFPTAVDAVLLRQSAGIGRHKPLVVSIGNLKPQKNAADLLSAAARVVEEVPEARFVFIGDGPQRTALQAKALALGLEGKFIFLGWRRDAAEWLAAADVFAMTSLWEGLPRALLEAMKSGRASVCYATDGVTDVLEDGVTGFAVEPGEIGKFSRRLVQLLTDEALRRKMGTNAAAAIGEEFDINIMVRQQETLYESLLLK